MSTHTLSRFPVSRPAVETGFWRRVWLALEDIGQRRARATLMQMARDYDGSRPDLARQLREASRHTLEA